MPSGINHTESLVDVGSGAQYDSLKVLKPDHEIKEQ